LLSPNVDGSSTEKNPEKQPKDKKGPFTGEDEKPGDKWEYIGDPRDPGQGHIWVHTKFNNSVEEFLLRKGVCFARVLVVQRLNNQRGKTEYMCARCYKVFRGALQVLKTHMRKCPKHVLDEEEKIFLDNHDKVEGKKREETQQRKKRKHNDSFGSPDTSGSPSDVMGGESRDQMDTPMEDREKHKERSGLKACGAGSKTKRPLDMTKSSDEKE
jgi:hypothetical protein